MMDFFDELRDKFRGLVNPSPGAFQVGRDQVSIGLLGPDVRPVADYLRSVYASRLVTVFAEDRVYPEGVFYNYYVFEQPGEPCYLILQAPIDARRPRFPSLAAGLPAVNWQEREIQDWFGLEATGHPNPRRVALHDNWPDVHPLRKDFDLRQTLPPFEGERHVYRPTLGEGVFQIPVGPVHAGIIEPGHFHRAVFLAESISGDSAFSHGTAFCQAIENVSDTEVPTRARVMRTILLELE